MRKKSFDDGHQLCFLVACTYFLALLFLFFVLRVFYAEFLPGHGHLQRHKEDIARVATKSCLWCGTRTREQNETSDRHCRVTERGIRFKMSSAAAQGLSEEQVADLKEAFAMFDINGDGK